MARVLVTGGAGFVGSHVAENLLRRKHDVVVLDDLSGGFRDNVPEGAALVEGSIVDIECVDSLFAAHRFDYVFHLAAYAAEALSHFIRSFNYTVNVLGSVNLINAAVRHDVRCFVFTSSSAVYGTESGPLREETPPIPADPYGIAKLAIEQDLAAARQQFGLDFIVFRAHNIYGERQNLCDPYRNVIGIFMKQILDGKPCTVFGDGTQTRSFSYIDDVAPLIAAGPFREAALNRVFNIGADESSSVRDLADQVQAALGRRVGLEYLPSRKEALHPRVEHARLKEVFGDGNSTSLEDGLRRMAEWARESTMRPSRLPPVELSRGLPESWKVS